MRWRDILFAIYSDNYGEYQARRLLSLRWLERRTRIRFLERLLTRGLDISEPLWPEMETQQDLVYKTRERAMQTITKKNRIEMELREFCEKINLVGEDAQSQAKARKRLDDLEHELRPLNDAADKAKQTAIAADARWRRILAANELLRIPPSQRAQAARQMADGLYKPAKRERFQDKPVAMVRVVPRKR